MTEPGRLAMSSLGRAVAHESTVAAAVAAAASLVGAAAPLLFGALVPVPAWITLAIAVALLAVLGWVIGTVLAAHRWLWAAAMLVGGAAVTVAGALLDIA